LEIAVPTRLKSRKSPVQDRSATTVDAIHQATIQVLLAEGLTRLTTTRVAERAGVSVGTLYQYFPNKEALLFAILSRHFEAVADALERVAGQGRPRSLGAVADSLAEAYCSVKTADPDATRALYRVAGAIDQFRAPVDAYRRMHAAVTNALGNASDTSFNDPGRAAFTLLTALAGLSRGSFGASADAQALDRLREEASLLAKAYLRAASA